VVATVEPWPKREGITAKLAPLLDAMPDSCRVIAPRSPASGGRARALSRAARAAVAGRVLVHPDLTAERVLPRLAAHLEEDDPPFVHLDTIGTAHLAQPLREMMAERGHHPPIVLSINDSYSLLRSDTPRRPGPLHRLEVAHLRRVERHVYADADVVDVVSPVDAAYLRDLVPRVPVRVLPLGRPTLGAPRDPEEPATIDLLLFGAAPGLVPFLEHGLPRLDPSSVVAMIGPEPPAAARPLMARYGVEHLGFVDDPAVVIRSANVVLAPSPQRAGTPNKALEAMAQQVAVVGGRCLHGIEGYENGVHGLSYDDPADLGLGVRSLLDDPARRATLALAGRTLVEQRLDWPGVAARYLATLPQTDARR
jgi:glycosyltransferase involved in cell wall biosynthesis